ncbi:MAG: PD40 domain-containing protein [Phycisphaeraceae bacterium]|nr:PD40 domain-containing protein [Phycisphaeraceae bacterium]
MVPSAALAIVLVALAADPPADAQRPVAGGHGEPTERAGSQPLDWPTLEAPLLRYQTQITSRDMFVKAGEAYFSPDSKWIIFQAVPVPKEGEQVDPFYSMYVAKLVRNQAGQVTGIATPILVSPPGSANTCGWFHPTEPWRILFGSTIGAPANTQKSGFSVGERKYVWMFPEEMDVVTRVVPEIAADDPAAAAPTPSDTSPQRLVARNNYDAECSWSKNGRFVLYAHVRDEQTRGRPDADIFVYDTKTNQHYPLVTGEGYDGGPFFSPDEKLICYRSDRKGDDLLQLYVAELLYNEEGVPVGITREHALTDDSNVSWAPFFHPSGRLLVYGTSAQGHQNYEVYTCEVDLDSPPSRIAKRRVTFADGADVLPVFSPDGSLFMWTAQRGPLAAGEQRPSSQLWIAECTPGGFDQPRAVFNVTDVHGLNPTTVEGIARAEVGKREEWASMSPIVVRQTETGWNVHAWNPSRKPGEGRLLVIDNAGRLVSYDVD